MTSNVAIVDDRNSLVSYSGQWKTAGESVEFNKTTSYSTSVGSTASFNFTGTSVTIYGTVSVGQGSISFDVDSGSETGIYSTSSLLSGSDSLHHVGLFTASGLSDGSHTILIKQVDVTAPGAIALDYIMYTTSPKTPLQGVTYFVDERDPRVVYSPGWGYSGSDLDFFHTSTGSGGHGQWALFSFQGIGVSFYGPINNGTVGNMLNASMSIDGGTPTYFSPTATQTANPTYGNQIFSTAQLSQGNHTLLITAENDNTVWIDYLLVTAGSPAGTPVPPSTSGLPATCTSSSPNHNFISAGAIAGIVVGGLLFLAGLVALLILFSHRQRAKRSDKRHEMMPPAPTPYVAIPTNSNSVEVPPATAWSSDTDSIRMSQAGGHNPLIFRPFRPGFSSHNHNTSDPDSSTRKLSPQPLTVDSSAYSQTRSSMAVSSIPTSHVDSGVRAGFRTDHPPPHYTAD